MKKVIVMLAVAVAAIAANAASFKWTASNIYGADGTTKVTSAITLYAYEVGVGSASSAFVATTVTPTTAGVVNTTFSSDSFTADKSYNFFFVVTDGDKTYTSAEKANIVAQATTTPTIGFGNLDTSTQTASNWKSVPEPTTGLLILLGVAGLALKRKVA